MRILVYNSPMLETRALVRSFEYGCIGWQYDMGEDQVDLEDIEGHFSIEFKSKTVEGLKNLLEVFGITEVIRGPTVVAVKERLGR
jgi:hypothetical protein